MSSLFLSKWGKTEDHCIVHCCMKQCAHSTAPVMTAFISNVVCPEKDASRCIVRMGSMGLPELPIIHAR